MMETLVIQSNTSELAKVESFIWNVVCERHITNYYGSMSVALMHAVRNAMEHGNKKDVKKSVSIECSDCDGGLRFSVADQGEGFDYGRFGEFPLSDDCGSGIYLMKCLSDGLVYEEGGRKVVMDFDVNGIDEEVAAERRWALNRVSKKEEVLLH